VIEDVDMSAVALAQDSMLVQDVEVSTRRPRRRFSAAFKVKLLEEAAQCATPGAIGALLRREGLYSSHLTTWKAAARRGELAGLAQRRGPKPTRRPADTKRVAELERQVVRLTARAEHAEALVALQKKVAELLGRPLASDAPSERRS
jgi:transposase-like protein